VSAPAVDHGLTRSKRVIERLVNARVFTPQDSRRDASPSRGRQSKHSTPQRRLHQRRGTLVPARRRDQLVADVVAPGVDPRRFADALVGDLEPFARTIPTASTYTRAGPQATSCHGTHSRRALLLIAPMGASQPRCPGLRQGRRAGVSSGAPVAPANRGGCRTNLVFAVCGVKPTSTREDKWVAARRG
jgi:hypothetical protein